MRTIIRALVVHEIARVKARCPALAIARAVSELSASAIFMHAELSCIARLTVHVITELCNCNVLSNSPQELKSKQNAN